MYSNDFGWASRDLFLLTSPYTPCSSLPRTTTQRLGYISSLVDAIIIWNNIASISFWLVAICILWQCVWCCDNCCSSWFFVRSNNQCLVNIVVFPSYHLVVLLSTILRWTKKRSSDSSWIHWFNCLTLVITIWNCLFNRRKNASKLILMFVRTWCWYSTI